jgi:ABC-type lipoprotein export system ATPase subunit
MNIDIVNSLYSRIIKSCNGVSPVKIDLHVHTPASHDFVLDTLESKDAYLKILDEAISANVQIIAITDHNTFSGYNRMCEILSDQHIPEKYKKIFIICGIEITCFSKHLLAIFPESFLKKDQESFLREIGIDESIEGSEEALADNLGPTLLIEKIGSYRGMAFLAHADSNKGFLHSLCNGELTQGELSFNGKSLAKIIKSCDLYGIQCNSDTNRAIIEEKLKNTDFKRKSCALAFIKCSDCHGVQIDGNYTGKSGHAMGTVFSQVKLSEISFDALKMALLDSEMRLFNEEAINQYPYIIGLAVKSPIIKGEDDYAVIHFNSELNCLIGARGTGKTTVLEIMQSIIMPNGLDAKTLKIAYSKYSAAIVYIKNDDTIFAIANEPRFEKDSYTHQTKCISNIKIYRKERNCSKFVLFKPSNDSLFLKQFLCAGYQQRQLFDYSRNPDKILDIIDNFISWKHQKEFERITSQIKHMENRLIEIIDKAKKERVRQDKTFINYISDNELENEISKIILIINQNKSQLRKLRIDMVDELNHVLSGKVQLSLTSKISEYDWEETIRHFASNIQHALGNDYNYYVKIKKVLDKAYICSCYAKEFTFYRMLLNREYSTIIESYKMTASIDDLEGIRSQIDEDVIATFINDGLKMEYNINSGTVFEEKFRDNSKISMGQNAVALLLLILNAAYNMDDNRPLLMDQPEDDLDNSYIYSTLVQEFRKSKEKRQVIISTHNPNIPVAADAEGIFVLRFNGQNGYLSTVGSIDSIKIAKDVLEIMEGGSKAIKKRMEKYNVRNQKL